MQPKSSSPVVEEAENKTDEDEDEDDDEHGAFHTIVKKKRRFNHGPRLHVLRKIGSVQLQKVDICVGLTAYSRELYDKSDTPAAESCSFR